MSLYQQRNETQCCQSVILSFMAELPYGQFVMKWECHCSGVAKGRVAMFTSEGTRVISGWWRKPLRSQSEGWTMSTPQALSTKDQLDAGQQWSLVLAVPPLSPSGIPSFRVSSVGPGPARLKVHHFITDAGSRCHPPACSKEADCFVQPTDSCPPGPCLSPGSGEMQDWQSTRPPASGQNCWLQKLESNVSPPHPAFQISPCFLLTFSFHFCSNVLSLRRVKPKGWTFSPAVSLFFKKLRWNSPDTKLTILK